MLPTTLICNSYFGHKGSQCAFHEGKKQFNCDICNDNFGQKIHLNVHVATVHEEKKQFNCNICNAKFGQKGNLNQHVAIVHERKKQFKCELCT